MNNGNNPLYNKLGELLVFQSQMEFMLAWLASSISNGLVAVSQFSDINTLSISKNLESVSKLIPKVPEDMKNSLSTLLTEIKAVDTKVQRIKHNAILVDNTLPNQLRSFGYGKHSTSPNPLDISGIETLIEELGALNGRMIELLRKLSTA